MTTLARLFGMLLLFAFAKAEAQWTRGANQGYFKLSAWFLEADQHYTSSGETDPNATRGQFNVNLYAEYGISDRWDVVAYVPFFSRTYQNDQVSGVTGNVITEGDEVNSIGDIDVGVRYGIIQKEKFVLAATLKLGLPTGESSGGVDGSYQTGDGEFNQLLELSAGTSFKIGTIPWYAKAYTGFNNRTDGFSDEFRVGAEVGSNMVPEKLWLAGRLNVVESLQNGDRNAQNSNGSIFANNIEYVSLGAEVNYNLSDRWGLSAAVDTAVSGRIVYAAPSYTAGVFFKL